MVKLIQLERAIHHALCNVIDPIFDKTLIYDNCANRKEKGSLFALKRFEKFQRKVTNNLTSEAYCLKADIKHYFREVDQEILLNIVKKKIKCEKTLWLIGVIIRGHNALGPARERERERERERYALGQFNEPIFCEHLS